MYSVNNPFCINYLINVLQALFISENTFRMFFFLEKNRRSRIISYVSDILGGVTWNIPHQHCHKGTLLIQNKKEILRKLRLYISFFFTITTLFYINIYSQQKGILVNFIYYIVVHRHISAYMDLSIFLTRFVLH